MSADTPTILLITASSPEIQRMRRSRVLNSQQITMPYLAAFVPPHWTVLHVDEAVEPVDLHKQVVLDIAVEPGLGLLPSLSSVVLPGIPKAPKKDE